jgi:hypothetical protein
VRRALTGKSKKAVTMTISILSLYTLVMALLCAGCCTGAAGDKHRWRRHRVARQDARLYKFF